MADDKHCNWRLGDTLYHVVNEDSFRRAFMRQVPGEMAYERGYLITDKFGGTAQHEGGGIRETIHVDTRAELPAPSTLF